MSHHIRFVCARCKRPISGCPKSCPEPAHRVEEVESCAICARTEYVRKLFDSLPPAPKGRGIPTATDGGFDDVEAQVDGSMDDPPVDTSVEDAKREARRERSRQWHLKHKEQKNG